MRHQNWARTAHFVSAGKRPFSSRRQFCEALPAFGQLTATHDGWQYRHSWQCQSCFCKKNLQFQKLNSRIPKLRASIMVSSLSPTATYKTDHSCRDLDEATAATHAETRTSQCSYEAVHPADAGQEPPCWQSCVSRAVKAKFARAAVQAGVIKRSCASAACGARAAQTEPGRLCCAGGVVQAELPNPGWPCLTQNPSRCFREYGSQADHSIGGSFFALGSRDSRHNPV